MARDVDAAGDDDPILALLKGRADGPDPPAARGRSSAPSRGLRRSPRRRAPKIAEPPRRLRFPRFMAAMRTGGMPAGGEPLPEQAAGAGAEARTRPVARRTIVRAALVMIAGLRPAVARQAHPLRNVTLSRRVRGLALLGAGALGVVFLLQAFGAAEPNAERSGGAEPDSAPADLLTGGGLRVPSYEPAYRSGSDRALAAEPLAAGSALLEAPLAEATWTDAPTVIRLAGEPGNTGAPAAGPVPARTAADSGAIDTSLGRAFYALGYRHQLSGRTEDALREYARAAALAPGHAATWYNWGYLLQRQGEQDEALAKYVDAIRVDPQHRHALYNLGYLLQTKGDESGAAEMYQGAIAAGAALPLTYYNLGYLRQKAGDLEGAAALYREALGHDPDLVLAHYGLGSVLEAVGDLDGARQHYLAALEITPDHAGAQAGLRRLAPAGAGAAPAGGG